MTTSIVDRLEEVASDRDGLLCDVWGVYHNGREVLPQAAAALRRFRDRDGVVVMLTNAPSPREMVAAMIERIGGSANDYDAIVTSGDATREALASGDWGRSCYYLGPDRHLDVVFGGSVERVGMEEAEFVLCAGLVDDSSESPDDYRDVLADALEAGLPMLCSNPDLQVDRGSDRVFCAGALALAYERMGGSVTYYGKPHPPVYRTALRRLAETAGRDLPNSRLLAIGDGIGTDVAGAAAMGIDCLFVTGGLASTEIDHRDGRPDESDLSAFLARRGASPLAATGHLA